MTFLGKKRWVSGVDSNLWETEVYGWTEYIESMKAKEAVSAEG